MTHFKHAHFCFLLLSIFSSFAHFLSDKHHSHTLIHCLKQKTFLLNLPHLCDSYKQKLAKGISWALGMSHKQFGNRNKQWADGVPTICVFLDQSGIGSWRTQKTEAERHTSPWAQACLIHTLLHTACVCVVVVTGVYPCCNSPMLQMTTSRFFLHKQRHINLT